jgi:hypothetical protein
LRRCQPENRSGHYNCSKNRRRCNRGTLFALPLFGSTSLPAITSLLIMTLSVFPATFLFCALLIVQGPEGTMLARCQEQASVPEPEQNPARSLPQSASGPEQGVEGGDSKDDPQRNLYWRMTRHGWRQIELPARELPPTYRIPRPLPRIHPFQASMLIVLATLAAIAWASDEWDWGRLVEDEGVLPDNGEAAG